MAQPRWAIVLLGSCLIWTSPTTGFAQGPLSIIDWLETEDPAPAEPGDPVTETASLPPIDVQPLAPVEAPIGVVGSEITGLPVTLWQNSEARHLARLMRAAPVLPYPAMQKLLYAMVLTEALPPQDDSDSTLLRAQVDKLVDLGALEPARALLDTVDLRSDPALFARWSDIAFLTGQEDDVCRILTSAPHLAPDRETLIFCIARQGDFNRASLLFDTSLALDLLSPEVSPALDRFLHPELFEEAAALPVPRAPTPLTFRLFEAIGESLPTAPLPRRFAAADLRDVAGWKAQLEAAERLARSGAISSNTLLGLYSERLPAASGGIWDRVAALQRFETALATQSAEAVSKSLPDAAQQMAQVGLSSPFADLFARRLSDFDDLTAPARAHALELIMLSPDYAELASTQSASTPKEAFLLALARDDLADALQPSPAARAIADGFMKPAFLPFELQSLGTGEAALRAMALFERGAAGNLSDLTQSLIVLRALGLDDTARQASLHLLITRDL